MNYIYSKLKTDVTSKVIANPILDGTEQQLTSLEVNGISYSVPSASNVTDLYIRIKINNELNGQDYIYLDLDKNLSVMLIQEAGIENITSLEDIVNVFNYAIEEGEDDYCISLLSILLAISKIRILSYQFNSLEEVKRTISYILPRLSYEEDKIILYNGEGDTFSFYFAALDSVESL